VSLELCVCTAFARSLRNAVSPEQRRVRKLLLSKNQFHVNDAFAVVQPGALSDFLVIVRESNRYCRITEAVGPFECRER
jgi:hypothetical protein